MRRTAIIAAAWALALGCVVAYAAPTVPPKPTPPRRPTVKGAKIEFDWLKNIVTVTGDARLTTAEGAIESQVIVAHLDKANAITTAEARGDVAVKYDYRGKDGVERIIIAKGDSAEYGATERTVRLSADKAKGHEVTGELREPASGRVVNIVADEVVFWVDKSLLVLTPAQVMFAEPATQKAPAAPAAQ